MTALGDKLAARRLASQIGVPIVPGSEIAGADAARSFAAQAGYPILIKAVAGGGGRGMRVVADEAALDAALEAAAREAQAAFGDGRIFLEKYLARPRHVEVQVLGDEHGRLVALGERECSIQRRHQKIIEESPAPGLPTRPASRMSTPRFRLACDVGYQSAGTVEFLVEAKSFTSLKSMLACRSSIR